MGVDQTHRSWVVGGQVVVKWMTEPLVGPHPAADRLRRLAAAGFAESPALWGVVEWREPRTGHWVPVAVAQSYLPGTEDGWTWAVTEARRALRLEPGHAQDFAADLGEVVGRMHLALAEDPPARLSRTLARQHADEALDRPRPRRPADRAARPRLPRAARRSTAPRIEAVLAGLADAAGAAVLPVHGDLHVGQVLRGPDGVRRRRLRRQPDAHARAPRRGRAGGRATSRACWSASRTSSHVARHGAAADGDADAAALDWTALAWTGHAQGLFLSGYRRALGDRADLFDPALVPAYAWEQVCREFVYAASTTCPSGSTSRPRRCVGGWSRPDGSRPLPRRPGGEAGPAAPASPLPARADPWAGRSARARVLGVPGHGLLPLREPGRGRPPARAGRRRPSPSWRLRPAARGGPGTTVVAVSASGGSAETLDAVRRLRAAGGGARFVALTNRADTELGDAVRPDGRPRAPGEERGGVACRSFQHTLALLLALEARLSGGPDVAVAAGPGSRGERPPPRHPRRPGSRPLSAAALGPHGTHVVAPARRISSALQSALMLREGPRLPAVGCETADWSHVDVYLTKTTDYRLVLLAGSRWEPELLDWVGRARQHAGRGGCRGARRGGDGALPARRRGRRPPAHRDAGLES